MHARRFNGKAAFRFRPLICDNKTPSQTTMMPMFLADLPWLQMSGAIAGGLVGSFSGFIANSFHEQRVRHRARRNIASALIGEIEALSQYIADNYLMLLREHFDTGSDDALSGYHHFRGDRDYSPVFRTIGATVGFLPAPLPRDLITWYTSLTAALERAHALHDLFGSTDAQSTARGERLLQVQRTALGDLVTLAKPLIARLETL
jgi:hypothetical protein